ncbi:MAG: VirB3 family type IV secretion system protein [Acidobacteriota bacterium]|nr:VirB3 family type IV secretion system protein [Acidobacteriota bacterium]
MRTIQRGKPIPINGALNRPRTKLGLELPVWMAIVFLTATVFLAGFRILALAAFAVQVLGAWSVTRKHPRMFELWFLSLRQRSYYDPRK